MLNFHRHKDPLFFVLDGNLSETTMFCSMAIVPLLRLPLFYQLLLIYNCSSMYHMVVVLNVIFGAVGLSFAGDDLRFMDGFTLLQMSGESGERVLRSFPTGNSHHGDATQKTHSISLKKNRTWNSSARAFQLAHFLEPPLLSLKLLDTG